MPDAFHSATAPDLPNFTVQSPSLPSTEAFDSKQVYTRLLTMLRELLHCSGAAVLVPCGPDGHVPVQFGPHPLPLEIKLNAEVLQVLARLEQMRQPLLQIHDVPFLPPLPAPASDVAWMGIPLIEDQFYACLSIVGAFRPGDERLAFALAQQTAMVLLWGQRHALARRQVQQAQALLTIGQQFQQAREWTAVLEVILDVVMETTTATHGSLFVIKNEQTILLARRGYSLSEEAVLQQIPPSLKHGLLGRAYQTRTSVRVDDIRLDPDALPTLSGTRSQMVIPVCSAEQMIGLIDLQSPHPYMFSNADATWLQTIGALTAVTIDRWRCQQMEQQLGTAEVIPQHQLLLSARLAAVNDLAAGVAHEINNPLTTILGYASMLLRNPSLPQVLADDIRRIVVGGQRIEALVGRFLRFAQPTSSGKRPLGIDEPLLEALELIRGPVQECGILVHVDMPDERPMVLAQPSQIVQVFLDLLQNAIEAMSTAEERRIDIQVSRRNNWASVAISDTGHGIMPEFLTRVFEPGFTTKVDQGVSRGIGLGLYAAHTIVRSHRGKIEVTSKIQQGSTFTVSLPTL